MKKQKLLFNRLLLRYKKHVLKLERLFVSNKNAHRQGVLKKHITRLYKKLTSLDVSIKQYSRAAVLGLALMGGSWSAFSQTSFKPFVRSPFNLTGDFYFDGIDFTDMDNDGDLDAVFRFDNSNTVFYKENIGNASEANFSLTQEVLINNLAVPATIDIDGDGDYDLIGINGGIIQFSENIGSPQVFNFSSLQEAPFNLDTSTLNGVYSEKLIVADLDNDGDLDILLTIGFGYSVAYFKNIGDAQNPSFDAPVVNPFGITSFGYAYLDAGDIDNDGDIDLLGIGVHESGYSDWLFYENQGVPGEALFNLPQQQPFNLNNAYAKGSPDLVDIDGDGDLDVLFGMYEYLDDPENMFFAENECVDLGTPALEFEGPYTGIYDIDTGVVDYNNYFLSSDFVDLDDDGDLDIFMVVVPVGYGQQSLYKENVGTVSNPEFSPAIPNPFGIIEPNSGIGGHFDFADIDGDGDYDAITGSGSSDELFYYENIGSASVPQFDIAQINPFNLTAETGISWLSPVFVDYNNDGLIDLVTGSTGVNQGNEGDFYFYQNVGTQTEPNFNVPVINPFGLISTGGDHNKVEFCDLDMDGDLDMFSGRELTPGYGGGEFLYYENTGNASSPNFAAPLINSFNLGPSYHEPYITTGDLDNDGDIDVLLGGRYTNNFEYFRNTIIGTPLPAPLTGGDITIPLGYDGTTAVEAVDLILFNPCDTILPFDTLTADFTLADPSHISTGPITVEVTAVTDGVATVVQSSLTVVDLLFPEIAPIEDRSVEVQPGEDFVVLPDFSPDVNATDNAEIDSITQDPPMGTQVPLNSTITVTITVTDTYGNATQEQFGVTATPSLGLVDDTLEAAIKMYPNPTDDVLTFTYKGNESLQSLQILDITGKIVHSISLSDNTNEQAIDTSKLAAGIYLVKIETETASAIKKLIKN